MSARFKEPTSRTNSLNMSSLKILNSVLAQISAEGIPYRALASALRSDVSYDMYEC